MSKLFKSISVTGLFVAMTVFLPNGCKEPPPTPHAHIPDGRLELSGEWSVIEEEVRSRVKAIDSYLAGLGYQVATSDWKKRLYKDERLVMFNIDARLPKEGVDIDYNVTLSGQDKQSKLTLQGRVESHQNPLSDGTDLETQTAFVLDQMLDNWPQSVRTASKSIGVLGRSSPNE